MRPATGARTGTGTWLVQRASAAVMVLAVPLFVWRIGCVAPLDYVAWKALFAPLWVRLASLLFSVALALHAWVGMRDIFMDYVHHTGVRLGLYLVVMLTLAGSVTWITIVLWGKV